MMLETAEARALVSTVSDSSLTSEVTLSYKSRPKLCLKERLTNVHR